MNFLLPEWDFVDSCFGPAWMAPPNFDVRLNRLINQDIRSPGGEIQDQSHLLAGVSCYTCLLLPR